MENKGEDVIGDTRQSQHPKILRNENPAILTDSFHIALNFLQSYGWFIVVGVILLIYLKHKFGSKVSAVTEKVAQMKKNDSYDPDLVRRRQEQMEAARRKLQEQYDAQAAIHAAEQAKKEEEKRKARIEDWDNHLQGKGYKSKIYKTADSSASSDSASGSTSSSGPRKNVYRQTDYNPLMGSSGGSGGYRPTRRSGGGNVRGGG